MAKKAKKKAARTALKKNARAGVRKALGPKKGAKPPRVWKSSRAGADRAASAKSTTKTAKQEPLIKGLRIRSLDNVCGHISDTRAAIARLQGEEADLEHQAHDLMKKHDQTTWQHAGVALVRIPGEEKLRVTTVRSRGPAPAAEPEGEGEGGVSQTPERAAAVDQTDGFENEGGATASDE